MPKTSERRSRGCRARGKLREGEERDFRDGMIVEREVECGNYSPGCFSASNVSCWLFFLIFPTD